MALLDHATKEITAKLVYYGPALCGKTTNLQWIHEHVAFVGKGKLLSVAIDADRMLFFDFLPVEFGTIGGMKTRVQIYTVPGQVFYDATRQIVLKGADAVAFVADSQASMLNANVESLENLGRNLIANHLDPALPMVFQYNKRDLDTALPVAALNARLNPKGLPFHEAVAIRGTGVEETLQSVVRLLFKSLSDFYGTEAMAPPPPSALPGPGQWVYLAGGEQRGPLDFEDLVDLVLTSVPEETMVWGPGISRWTPANVVPEIAEHIPPPLPLVALAREEDFPDFNTVPRMLRTALIADEDAAFRQRLALPLAAQGFKIYAARDGAEAWRLATEHRPWVMLA